MWLAQPAHVAVLRFYDEKNLAQSTEISERVFFGLSKDIMEGVEIFRKKDKNIRADKSTKNITADDQIHSVVLDDLILDLEPVPGN